MPFVTQSFWVCLGRWRRIKCSWWAVSEGWGPSPTYRLCMVLFGKKMIELLLWTSMNTNHQTNFEPIICMAVNGNTNIQRYTAKSLPMTSLHARPPQSWTTRRSWKSWSSSRRERRAVRNCAKRITKFDVVLGSFRSTRTFQHGQGQFASWWCPTYEPWSILTMWLMVIPSMIRILMVVINPYVNHWMTSPY